MQSTVMKKDDDDEDGEGEQRDDRSAKKLRWPECSDYSETLKHGIPAFMSFKYRNRENPTNNLRRIQRVIFETLNLEAGPETMKSSCVQVCKGVKRYKLLSKSICTSCWSIPNDLLIGLHCQKAS